MWFHDFDDLPDEEQKELKGKASQYVRRLWPFFRPYAGRIGGSAALLLASTGLGLLGPVLLKRAIDVNIAAGREGLAGLAVTTLLYLASQAGTIAAGYFQSVWLAQVGEWGAAGLKQRLFRHLLDLPMAFFDRTPVGKLISRVESDTEALKTLFTRTTVMLLQGGLMIVGMSAVMAVANWRLCLLVLVLLPPFAVAFWVFQKKVRPLYLGIRKTVAETNNLVSESLKGLPVIQVFGQQERFGRRMDELNRQKFRAEVRAYGMWNIVWFLVDFGDVICTGMVLALGGAWALQGKLTIGTLFLFVSYITRLFGPLRMISDQINMMQRAFASAERSFQLLDEGPEPAGSGSRERLVLGRQIACEHVDFSYDGKTFVLHDLNLVIRKGEKVALVGETGGGKTSIVSLLMKFYLCQRGRIRYDSEELATMERHRLRQAVGFVPQEVTMFPGTVLDNLRMLDDSVPAEQVVAAAKRARVHEAVTRFEKGYDSLLTEGGANFSLGERQLLAFARALVRDPQILILDEATSSVDPHTEHLIQEGLAELLRGRTAIIVAHRLATIRMADRVVVVHKGRVAEQGTHDELVAKDGIYAKLYRLQYVSEAA
ncbi:ABC transporter ATP-binding protein [candidate division WOR-3 bacterium]|nr:ABC transporter ATP-binding protein [candidate division WOR-3 bacterium]